MITTTEMFPTTVILWDKKVSEKAEFAGLNRKIRQLLSSLVENSSSGKWEEYLLPAIGVTPDEPLFENGIDSIAPMYAIRNDQILPEKYLLRGEFFADGQKEKEMVLCFSLNDSQATIIPMDKTIIDSGLTILIRALTAYPFLKLTSLHGKHPISSACRIKDMSNVIELDCLSEKIKNLSAAQIKALNLELMDY